MDSNRLPARKRIIFCEFYNNDRFYFDISNGLNITMLNPESAYVLQRNCCARVDAMSKVKMKAVILSKHSGLVLLSLCNADRP